MPRWRLVFRDLIESADTSISMSAADARTVIIEDDGPGIAEDQRAVVFERFIVTLPPLSGDWSPVSEMT